MCDPVTAVVTAIGIGGTAAYAADQQRKAVHRQADAQRAADQEAAQRQIQAPIDAAKAAENERITAEANAANAANAKLRAERLRRRAQQSLLGSFTADTFGGLPDGRKMIPKVPPSVLASAGGAGSAITNSGTKFLGAGSIYDGQRRSMVA